VSALFFGSERECKRNIFFWARAQLCYWARVQNIWARPSMFKIEEISQLLSKRWSKIQNNTSAHINISSNFQQSGLINRDSLSRSNVIQAGVPCSPGAHSKRVGGGCVTLMEAPTLSVCLIYTHTCMHRIERDAWAGWQMLISLATGGGPNPRGDETSAHISCTHEHAAHLHIHNNI